MHLNKHGERTMKITELLLAELDQEAIGIRKTLQNVPEGKNDWKPHEKSMPLGNLATIVATIPAWLDMVVNMDEIDINPPGGSKFKPQPWNTRTELLEQFESSLKKGREVLQKTNDDRLLKYEVAHAGRGQIDDGADALRSDSRGRPQPHGAPPRPTHRLSAAQSAKSPCDILSISG
jgi:hypothetical protein